MSKFDFEKRLNSVGIFTYYNDSFEAKFPAGSKKYNWADIVKIIAYKVDLIAVDEIVIEVHFLNNLMFTITEETDGYYQFMTRCRHVFPEIPADWEAKIVLPPFARNETVLVDRPAQ